MNAARERTLREAAIGAAHNVITTDDFRQSYDPLGDEFGMLDDVGRVTYHARNQNLAGRELHIFPHPPLVGMSRIGRLEGIVANAHFQNEIDDVLKRDVEGVRTV